MRAQWPRFRRVVRIALPFVAFLVGIRGLGVGFKLLGSDALQHIFEVSANPFVGLLIGILSTSIVQSSSVTTSMVVGLVAAPEVPLPVAHAIPMIMGANIGTTVTNTVVSMAHIGRPAEFRRAIAAGTCDDFFNLLAVAILLPLEIATGILQRTSALIVGLIPPSDGALSNPIAAAADWVLAPIEHLSLELGGPGMLGAALFLAVTGGLIFGSLSQLIVQLRDMTGGKFEGSVTRALDASPLVGLSAGALLTALVQSSSLTLSVLVPLAGTGIMTLEQIFPVVLGANFGTTITAFLASTAVPIESFRGAVQIALVHLLFNLVGILLIYPWARARKVPLDLARWIAGVAERSKLRALAYVVSLFYLLPVAGLIAWRLLR